MVITDTGFWLALLNKTDTYHAQALQAVATIKEPLITTWPVVTETCYFLLKERGNSAQVGFVDLLAEGDCRIFKLKLSHLPRISQLLEKYADLPMDLADASLVILAEDLNDGRILSVDQRDFNTYRWKNRKPFKNLMFPVE